MGPTVDPLGDVFMRLLPDGLYWLLAPAAALPALLFAQPVVELPVVVPFVIVSDCVVDWSDIVVLVLLFCWLELPVFC